MSGNLKRLSRTSLPSMEHSKVPPNAIEFEDAVLGACLLESEVIDDVSSILSPDSFYKIEHQKIFSAIIALHGRSNPVDILTVTQELKSGGHINESLSPYFISKLTERIAGGANAEYHARIIQQKFIARELIRVSGDIYHEAYEDTTDALELLDRAEIAFSSIGSDSLGEKIASNQEVFMECVETSEQAAKGGNVSGLSTGLPEVDRLTGGLQEGHLDILAARPAMGKTTKAIGEAYHVAVILGLPVLFYSLEMTAKELMYKLIALHTGIDSIKIKNGNLTAYEWSKFNAAGAILIKAPLTIIDNITQLKSIRSESIKRHKRGEVKFIVFDYLQLIDIDGWKGNEETMVSEVSKKLKQLAKLLQVPILALAQLSRAVETRGGTKRPMLSDLRSSGQIEANADSVTFLYRPEYYGTEVSEEFGSSQGLCEVIVAKNRGGRTGTAPTRVDLATGIFSPWEAESFTAPPPPPREGVTQKWSPMPRSEEFDDDAF